MNSAQYYIQKYLVNQFEKKNWKLLIKNSHKIYNIFTQCFSEINEY